MDGCVQHPYPRKNWSSFMVFNCSHPSVWRLTPSIVNEASPSFLHRFQWLADEEIGSLSIGWNYLAGIYPKISRNIKAIHYTLGGPWFEGFQISDFSEKWIEEEAHWMSEVPLLEGSQ